MRNFSCLAVVTSIFFFAFPALVNAQLLQRLEQRLNQAVGQIPPRTESTLPTPGPEDRPTLGLNTAEEGEPGGGVLVVSTVPNGPAAKAGLREGDLITRANGKPVNSPNDLGDILSGAKVGDKATLTVRVAGRDKSLDLTFARRAAEPTPANPLTESNDPLADGADRRPLSRPAVPNRVDAVEPAGDVGGRPTLGISVGPITEDAQARYGVTTRRGALVTAIRADGPADRAGVPIGGVVVAMDGVRIDTADQLVDAIRTSKPGQEVELTYYNGPELTRKTLRLGSAGPAPAGIGEASPRTNRIDLGPAAADRPLLRGVERAINNLGGGAGVVVEPGQPGEVAALRQEVAELRDRVRALEDRIERIGRSPEPPAAAPEEPAAIPPRFAPPTP
jgi:serine protease Do